jgi:hypothetical protein
VRIGEVRVREEPRLEIWARDALPVAYVTLDAEQFVTPFLHSVATVGPWPDPRLRIQDEPLSDAIILARAHLDETTYRRGDTLHLLLVWEVRAPAPLDYKLFVHMADQSGRPVAQWDGLPGLNTARTSTWAVGSQFRDHVLLRIPDAAQPGAYSLLVGLYDPATGERLGGRALTVTQVRIH